MTTNLWVFTYHGCKYEFLHALTLFNGPLAHNTPDPIPTRSLRLKDLDALQKGHGGGTV
jgi:hypothetical protein